MPSRNGSSSRPIRYVGGDLLAAQVEFTGGLGVGQFFSQTVSARMPNTPSQRWIVVEADVNNSVTEVLENNNSLVSTNRIFVEPAYNAVVHTDTGAVLANTPIPLYGEATLVGGGAGGQRAAHAARLGARRRPHLRDLQRSRWTLHQCVPSAAE